MDNNEVHILSKFHNPNQLTTVQRRNKDGVRTSTSCPSSNVDYNNNMNAVDKFDQLISCSRLDRFSFSVHLLYFI